MLVFFEPESTIPANPVSGAVAVLTVKLHFVFFFTIRATAG